MKNQKIFQWTPPLGTLAMALTLLSSSQSLQADCTGDFELRNQDEVNAFSCTGILTGSLLIDGSSDDVRQLRNLTALNGLTSITGNLRISDNPYLTNLDGLEGITSVGRNLSVYHNNALSNINGLSGINSVGFLYIADNGALENLGGLGGITSVGSTVYILENDSLTDISGLSGITSVGGSLWIEDNYVLPDLDGLEGLTRIGSDADRHGLMITGNPSLANIDGLSSLSKVGGSVLINFNHSLTNLNGLSSLSSVGEDYDTLPGSEGWVIISDNSVLDQFCGLFHLLNSGGLPGDYIVQDNLANPTREDILDAGVCDSDGDGIPDYIDQTPDSRDVGGAIKIGQVDTGVENIVFEDGNTLSDLIHEMSVTTRNHGGFVRSVQTLNFFLYRNNVLTWWEARRLQQAAVQSRPQRPRFRNSFPKATQFR